MSEFDPKSSKAEYLALASQSLKQARAIRGVGGARADTYAALELRHAFEALIYERAIDYLADLSRDDVRTWQPHLLLQRIVEIDPTADLSVEFSIKLTPGEKDWFNLGRAQRIGLGELKKHYFALGSFLHTPALASVLKGKVSDEKKVTEQCDKSEVVLARVLGSTLRMNMHEIFGRTALECSGCGTTISRSLAALSTPQNGRPGTKEVISIDCPNCSASFDVFFREGDGIVWREQRWQRPCPVQGCDGWHSEWLREMKDGIRTTCSDCGTVCELRQAFIFRPLVNDAKVQE